MRIVTGFLLFAYLKNSVAANNCNTLEELTQDHIVNENTVHDTWGKASAFNVIEYAPEYKTKTDLFNDYFMGDKFSPEFDFSKVNFNDFAQINEYFDKEFQTLAAQDYRCLTLACPMSLSTDRLVQTLANFNNKDHLSVDDANTILRLIYLIVSDPNAFIDDVSRRYDINQIMQQMINKITEGDKRNLIINNFVDTALVKDLPIGKWQSCEQKANNIKVFCHFTNYFTKKQELKNSCNKLRILGS